MDPRRMSIVEYLGNDGGHRCGYCGNSSGFVAPGMWAHRLTVRDLQVNPKISNNNYLSKLVLKLHMVIVVSFSVVNDF